MAFNANYRCSWGGWLTVEYKQIILLAVEACHVCSTHYITLLDREQDDVQTEYILEHIKACFTLTLRHFFVIAPCITRDHILKYYIYHKIVKYHAISYFK